MVERTLLDRYGNPVNRAALAAPIEPPTIGSIRAPMAGYPGDGLTPVRLANILRAADMGDPVRYLELAEQIEERNPHYLAVLSTRKRSVSQLDISVEAASDAADDIKRADMIRDWLKRDELAEELFYLLDCLGKGFSFTAVNWAKSNGQWWPEKLEQCDPRGFRFSRRDLTTPMQINDRGIEEPLDPFRYIYAQIMAKSGLPLRGGLARVAAWGWMFKAYTERDWAIFTQTYGQPLRVGKYHEQASETDRDKLFQAVAGIAGDCAAIIPDNMNIDFVETKNVGASTDLYLNRADWLDRQISKAVLGQTATTDAEVGGLGSGKEHRQVQEDIERADAKALAAILNRDLIRPWMELEYGKLERYPRIVIARPEAEDLQLLSTSLANLIPLGLKVSMSEVRGKFGLSEPKAGDELLIDPQQPPATPPESGIEYPFNTQLPKSGVSAPQSQQAPSAGQNRAAADLAGLTARLQSDGRPAMGAILSQIETMMEVAGSLEELREMLHAGFDEIDSSVLERVLEQGFMTAHAAGQTAVVDTDA